MTRALFRAWLSTEPLGRLPTLFIGRLVKGAPHLGALLQNYRLCYLLHVQNIPTYFRAVAIRFGVIRLVVRAQECYTLGGPGGMLPQEKFEM